MKATCPKCGRALHIWDWRQDCPSCGVNMVGYDLQARLLRDADQAEAEFARVQPYIDRAKASYVGSKPAIVRLCCSILPAAATLLPLVNVGGRRVNIVGIVSWIAGAVQGGMTFALDGTALSGSLRLMAPATAGLLLWTVLLLLARLGFIAGSCSRSGRLRLYDLDLRMLLAAGAALVVLSRLARALPAAVPTVGFCRVGWGAYIFLLLLAVVAAFDVALARIGIPVDYKTCCIRGMPADVFFAMQKQTAATTK